MIICFNKSSELKLKFRNLLVSLFYWNILGQKKYVKRSMNKLCKINDWLCGNRLYAIGFYLRRIKISTLTRCCCGCISGVLNRAKINFNKLRGFLLYRESMVCIMIFVRLMQLRNKRHSSLHYGHLISLNSETTSIYLTTNTQIYELHTKTHKDT